MLFRFDPFEPFERAERRRPALLAMDAVRHDDTVYVYFDVPGVAPDRIDLTVERNSVTVSVDRHWEETDGERIITAERAQGNFSRQIQLGETLDTDNVKASLDQGVLTLEIPVREDTRPKRVEISSQGGQRELETSGGA